MWVVTEPIFSENYARDTKVLNVYPHPPVICYIRQIPFYSRVRVDIENPAESKRLRHQILV